MSARLELGRHVHEGIRDPAVLEELKMKLAEM